MRKEVFLDQLRKGLSALMPDDAEERLTFYSEMIDDRMEEGLSEEEAVASVGSVAEILAQITAESPLSKEEKEPLPQKRKLSAGEIALLVLGSPIWLSLAIAAFAVILSLYVSLWAVLISLWSVFLSCAACFLGGILACVLLLLCCSTASGLLMLAGGLVCAGLSIFLFFGCKAATQGVVLLTKKCTKYFIRKEEAACIWQQRLG